VGKRGADHLGPSPMSLRYLLHLLSATVSWLARIVSTNLAFVLRHILTPPPLQAPFTVYMRGYEITC